ncbi:radical SAM protein [Paenibacillus glucanolyticus]|uniref:radical SAM protein n=1 Tax=Paenibacillus glucanolyticus TaxID=59843 RepID=UPI00096ECD9E|nr:radical SAM protein [Paenibacillus glucanolyticus]OMF81585.1 hypothetical protein BK142_03665 [Paenibacillus glucanolyticus]
MNRIYEDVVTMYLLAQCDMKCKFCYASKDTGRLSLEEAKSIIDFFASLGATRISLTGGEALMHPRVDQIVKYAFDKGFKVNLFTSGSLLTEERFIKLAPYIKWLTLSLDGGNPELNMKMGRREGHYENVLTALKFTKRIAPHVNVRLVTVVTKINTGQLQEIGEIIKDEELKPTWWRLKQMVALRSGKDNEKELGITDEQFLTDINALKGRFDQYIDVDGSLATSKSGDIMIIHPNGECTTTKFLNNQFQLINLGNILSEPMATVENWWDLRDKDNANFYQGIWTRANG